jgi:hypothetical protein
MKAAAFTLDVSTRLLALAALVVFSLAAIYGRCMSVFRRANSQQSKPGVGRSVAGTGMGRPARFLGRVLLWGCVLLLLVRGVSSYLSSDPGPATGPRGGGVTVTQPTRSVPSPEAR